MKLYIFKCRTRPRMYGATRYETASNLPTGQCSGGWEFHERVDLTPQGRLRYAVDTRTVRRYIEQKGWHVWDESPLESRRKESEAPRVPQQPPVVESETAVPSKPAEPPSTPAAETPPVLERQPLKQEVAGSGESPVFSRKEVKEVETVSPTFSREQPRPPEREPRVRDKLPEPPRRETVERAPLPQRTEPSFEPETIASDDLAAFLRRELADNAPSPRRPHPATEPRTIVPDESASSRKEAAESTSAPRRRHEPPVSPRTDTTSAATAQTKGPPLRRTTDGLPSQTSMPDKVGAPTSAPRLKPRHQIVWFDIPVRDIDRAVRFYSAVLGTPLKKEQAGPGAAVAVLPRSEGSIGGSLIQNMDAKPSDSGPLLYLNTEGRLDEAVAAVESHGGRVLVEKHSIAPFGFRAVVLDSEGNRVALHST